MQHVRKLSIAVGTALLCGGLSLPARAQSMQQFATSGPMTHIDDGDVKPAGDSGRWVVKDRHVTGVLYGSIGGTTGEEFLLTYGSNVPILTQSGNVHADFSVGAYTASMELESSIGLTPLTCSTPDGATCIGTPNGNFIPGLIIQGTATFTSGTEGHGNVYGWLIPELDAAGHIARIIAANLSISGQWKP